MTEKHIKIIGMAAEWLVILTTIWAIAYTIWAIRPQQSPAQLSAGTQNTEKTQK